MKRYLDTPLIIFVIIMISAASITSHGTYVFYRYFMDEELAIAATIVITSGIPLLELAAVLNERGRFRYIAGMIWLLLMEGIAQYFSGQAVFASRVATQFPDATGIDIAMLAAQPHGRLLPVVYLASLSAIVVYFGYAASRRVADLRGMQPIVNLVAADETATATDVHDLATEVVFLRDERKLTWDEIKELTGKSRTWVTRLYNERKGVATT
jgi:hypothetical protein